VSDYYLAVDGQPTGPYPDTDLVARLRAGTLDGGTLCWQDGMQEWTPVAARLPVAGTDGTVSSPQWTPSSAARAVPASVDRPAQEQYFVHVSPRRLIVMSVLSFGLFEWWWAFKNWRYVRANGRSDIWPFWRASFSIFHTHGLMRHMHADREPGVSEPHDFSPNAMAWGYVVMWLLSTAIGNSDSLGVSMLAPWLPSYLFLVPAQVHVNAIVRARTPERGDYPWSLGQGLCVAFGAIVWVIVILSLLVEAGG
jgi:GYF domain 2